MLMTSWATYVLIGVIYYMFNLPRVIWFVSEMDEKSLVDLVATVLFLVSVGLLWPLFLWWDIKELL